LRRRPVVWRGAGAADALWNAGVIGIRLQVLGIRYQDDI
jgi:hypothetical protein